MLCHGSALCGFRPQADFAARRVRESVARVVPEPIAALGSLLHFLEHVVHEVEKRRGPHES